MNGDPVRSDCDNVGKAELGLDMISDFAPPTRGRGLCGIFLDPDHLYLLWHQIVFVDDFNERIHGHMQRPLARVELIRGCFREFPISTKPIRKDVSVPTATTKKSKKSKVAL